MLQTYAAQLASPMDLLGEAFGLSETELRALGLPASEARELFHLAQVYFGPTAFSARQRAARATAHSLPTLKLIERYAARAGSQREAWALRERLCTDAGDTPQIQTLARSLVPARRPPQRGVRLTRRRDGDWTLSITGESSLLADVYAAVGSGVEGVDKLIRHGAGRARVTTNVIVTLDALDRILDGDGEEVTLRMTNGATLTGAQLLQRTLSEHGYATLVHPVSGPVNLYRTQRLASAKQRIMASAQNPTCAWPGCNHPADTAQIHHLRAWHHGGNTNADNLAVCCSYHNSINDDDPNAPPRRGRLVRQEGRVTWIPPWG